MTKKAKSKKCGLRAINDIYIVKEDPIEASYETGSTSAVTDAIKAGLLILPDKFEAFANKYPCRGTVISKGDKTRQDIKIGDKIIYARMGVQRYEFDGKMFCDVRECDVHAILEPC